MNKYLLSVILSSISIGLCDILVPKHNGIDRLVKFIGMLIILIVSVNPVMEVIGKIDQGILDGIKNDLTVKDESYLDEYNSIFEQYLNDHSIDEIQEYIKKILEQKYSIPSEECRIQIDTAQLESELTITNIRILLSGTSIFKNPYKIEIEIESIFSCECQVLIDTVGG
jgi:hypothetical protein